MDAHSRFSLVCSTVAKLFCKSKRIVFAFSWKITRRFFDRSHMHVLTALYNIPISSFAYFDKLSPIKSAKLRLPNSTVFFRKSLSICSGTENDIHLSLISFQNYQKLLTNSSSVLIRQNSSFKITANCHIMFQWPSYLPWLTYNVE